MGLDLTGLDFSGVAVRQADLRERRLQAVNFSGADLSDSLFADTFHTILSLAISPRPEERLLAAGTMQGEVRLWRLADGKPLLSCAAHSGWDDKTVRRWDVASGECLAVLTGHTGAVNTVACNPAATAPSIFQDDESTEKSNDFVI